MANPYYQPYWTDTDFLEHHGVKNQKWGEKNGPPYPLDRGKDGRVTQTQKKKKQGVIARMRAEHQKKVKAKQRAKKAAETKKQKAKEAEEQMTKEEIREKLLKSTDPKFIIKHIDLLSTNEINDRLNRISAEQRVKDLLKDDSSKKKIEKGMNWVNNISKIAETSSKVAKAYSDVVEAAGKSDKLRDESEKRKAETALAKSTAAAADKSMNNASEAMANLVKEYGKNTSAFANIQMEFDAKTGKMLFKPIKQDKGGNDNNNNSSGGSGNKNKNKRNKRNKR